jgi:putative peptidoglycan lipid II flippase
VSGLRRVSFPTSPRPPIGGHRGGGGAERFVVRAAGVTAVLTAGGALCGLARDQIVARLFGADGDTDAFLVAWTIPEFAATLLIEDAMALVLVPAFSLALAQGQDEGQGGGQVRRLAAATFPRLLLALAVAAAALAAAAGPLVRALAPGLADTALAVDCVRLTAASVLSFGVAGYFSALLRAHRSFLPPAAIYIAYNLGIIATALTLGGTWGVRAAAAGVAAGGVLMVLVQLPFALRRIFSPPRHPLPPPGVQGAEPSVPGTGGVRALSLAVAAPVALFALARQSQVLVERFLGSTLPPGAISHLNYAQKVAQMPMVLSMMICTVTLPLVARALAEGDTHRARQRVERDLVLAATVVLTGAAYVVACAPQIIEVLFQRGAFGAEATAATATVMRVYALGLLGHTLVGTLVRPFFSGASATHRPVWYPLAAMGGGLLVTAAAGLAAVRLAGWGAPGIAAANAAGICLTACVLLRGLRARVVPIDTRAVLARLGHLVLAAALATATGWYAAGLAASPVAACALGAVTVTAVLTAVLRLLSLRPSPGSEKPTHDRDDTDHTDDTPDGRADTAPRQTSASASASTRT